MIASGVNVRERWGCSKNNAILNLSVQRNASLVYLKKGKSADHLQPQFN